MKGIVWGRNFNRACRKLDSIKHSYLIGYISIIQEVRTKHEYKLVFENGDSWRALSAGDWSYGYKANISYIDSTIDEEIVHTIILPCTISLPYNAYNYYNLDEE